jgi:hypothetical protein
VDAGLTDIVDVRLEWDDSDWVIDQKPHINYLRLVGRRRRPEHSRPVVRQVHSTHPWQTRRRRHRVGPLPHGDQQRTNHGVRRTPGSGVGPDRGPGPIRSKRPIAHVGYAEDALDWWLHKNRATHTERAEKRRRIRQWRRDNYFDVAAVIRKIRFDHVTIYAPSGSEPFPARGCHDATRR